MYHLAIDIGVGIAIGSFAYKLQNNKRLRNRDRDRMSCAHLNYYSGDKRPCINVEISWCYSVISFIAGSTIQIYHLALILYVLFLTNLYIFFSFVSCQFPISYVKYYISTPVNGGLVFQFNVARTKI